MWRGLRDYVRTLIIVEECKCCTCHDLSCYCISSLSEDQTRLCQVGKNKRGRKLKSWRCLMYSILLACHGRTYSSCRGVFNSSCQCSAYTSARVPLLTRFIPSGGQGTNTLPSVISICVGFLSSFRVPARWAANLPWACWKINDNSCQT